METQKPHIPVSEDVKKQLTDALRGSPAGVKYTVDGEVQLVYGDNAQRVEQPLVEEPLDEMEASFKDKHHEAMVLLNEAILSVKRMKNRQVPLTRDELNDAVSKKTLRQLENFGLVQQRIVPLLRASTGTSVGGKALIYFTPQGRAYVRERIQNLRATT